MSEHTCLWKVFKKLMWKVKWKAPNEKHQMKARWRVHFCPEGRKVERRSWRSEDIMFKVQSKGWQCREWLKSHGWADFIHRKKNTHNHESRHWEALHTKQTSRKKQMQKQYPYLAEKHNLTLSSVGRPTVVYYWSFQCDLKSCSQWSFLTLTPSWPQTAMLLFFCASRVFFFARLMSTCCMFL